MTLFCGVQRIYEKDRCWRKNNQFDGFLGQKKIHIEGRDCGKGFEKKTRNCKLNTQFVLVSFFPNVVDPFNNSFIIAIFIFIFFRVSHRAGTGLENCGYNFYLWDTILHSWSSQFCYEDCKINDNYNGIWQVLARCRHIGVSLHPDGKCLWGFYQ